MSPRGEPRNVRKIINYTDEEVALLEAAAKLDNRSFSDYVRLRSLAAARKEVPGQQQEGAD